MLRPRHSRASTTLRRALAGPSGIPEVSSGIPSPPSSPPLAAKYSAARSSSPRSSSVVKACKEGAAHAISGECERLFCGTLRAVFLGEGNQSRTDSLEMGAQSFDDHQHPVTGGAVLRYGVLTPEDSMCSGQPLSDRLVDHWLEVWDYTGGARFRGFVAAQPDGTRALFAFFDEGATGRDLKPGLMGLLELCDIPGFDCESVFACLDRAMAPKELKALTRDLGWVGFEPATLVDWTRSDDIISDKWIFLSMEV